MAINPSALTAVRPTSKPELTTLINEDTFVVFRGNSSNLQMYRFKYQSLLQLIENNSTAVNIINNLTSTATTDGLSALQGKLLKDQIDIIESALLNKLDVSAYNSKFKGRFTTLGSLETSTIGIITLEAGDYAVIDDVDTPGDTLVYVWDADSNNPDGGSWVQSGSIGPNTTDDLAEGSMNLYFTDVNLQNAFASEVVNTDNLVEGSTNLYFTNVNLQNAFASEVVNTDKLVEGNANLYFTDERVHLALGRSNFEYNGPSIAPNDNHTGDAVLFNTSIILTISTNSPLRVRLYVDTLSRDNDLLRPIGTDPIGNHGLLLEFVSTNSLLFQFLSPAIIAYAADSYSDTLPFSITNLGSSNANASFFLEYIPLGTNL
jgi:hypothetical protein